MKETVMIQWSWQISPTVYVPVPRITIRSLSHVGSIIFSIFFGTILRIVRIVLGSLWWLVYRPWNWHSTQNGWLEYYTFLLGRPIFRYYVSFRLGYSNINEICESFAKSTSQCSKITCPRIHGRYGNCHRLHWCHLRASRKRGELPRSFNRTRKSRIRIDMSYLILFDIWIFDNICFQHVYS